ncbi:hypothetical protein BC941DRAFT_438230 [Chlamydoabsidia padenii]|nr:hypothetical protein BC941DRAFT_438230 [Chlamydoabsidia padenii]
MARTSKRRGKNGLKRYEAYTNRAVDKFFKTYPTQLLIIPSTKQICTQPLPKILTFSLDIWSFILPNLPLWQILELPLVCRDFRDKVFNIPVFWKLAYVLALEQNHPRMHTVIPRQDLWNQGLFCRRWFASAVTGICDQCYAGYQVTSSQYGWLSVQPVSLNNNSYTIHLCGPCRIFHYQIHPEPIQVDPTCDLVAMPRDQLISKYGLVESDIGWLSHQHMTDAFIHLYARVIFGGEVGITAQKQKQKKISC